MSDWDSLPPDLSHPEPPVSGLLAGGRQHLPGDGGGGLGVLGAGRVQEHGQEVLLSRSHHGRSQHLHGRGRLHFGKDINWPKTFFEDYW